MVGRAQSATAGGQRSRHASDGAGEGRGRRSNSVDLDAGDTASFVSHLIPSSAISATLRHDSSAEPLLLDVTTLLGVPLTPLSSEVAGAPAALVSPVSASMDSDLAALIGGNVGRYDVHRLERRGLKADAELLAQVTRLLTGLCAETWQPLPSFVVKGGVKVGERLSAELNFFQDANVFLLLLAPMLPPVLSSAVVASAESDASVSSSFHSSTLLTAIESCVLVSQFLSAKPGGRRKVFRHYEERFRSREEAEKAAAESRSKEIERQMEVDAEKERRVTKLLLLGPAEAGKSTLFKQVKKLYGDGFNAIDRQSHSVIILANLLRAMRALIFHSERLLVRFPFSALENLTGASTSTVDPALDASVAFINSFDLVQHFPSLVLNSAEKIVPQVVPASVVSAVTGEAFPVLFKTALGHIAALWQDLGVQLTYENRAKFDVHQLYDGDGFFLSRLTELRDIRWLPTEEDIIRTRVRSLGVEQYQWEDASGQRYRLTDVAGQRSERTKWMGFFNDATCVIFVAALSEYDQVLSEDPGVNRLQETLQTFQQLTTVHWFDPIPLVLLLNKADLYREKIQRVSLKLCFPKYRGGKGEGKDEAEEGLEFIQNEFLKRVRSAGEPGKERPVFVHVVSAVQADSARVCMKQINAIVRDRILQSSQQGQMQ